jgi:hypothetical protein
MLGNLPSEMPSDVLSHVLFSVRSGEPFWANCGSQTAATAFQYTTLYLGPIPLSSHYR